MSGPLLLGIAAVGVGWAWLSRDPREVHAVDSAPATAVAGAAADAATVAAETGHGDSGTAAVTCAVEDGSPSRTVGDVGVTGADGGQVLPVNYSGPDGQSQMVIDPNKSTGGADPSTQSSGLWAGPRDTVRDGGPVKSPIQTPGDQEDVILQAKYGKNGSQGMTRQAATQAFRESAFWSGEVF